MKLPCAEVASPNHGPRPAGARIDMIVLHYTEMASASAAIDRLADPRSQVSAHYVVARDGAVTRLVGEDRRAWHAGRARWGDVTDVNGRSIGIELDNRGQPAFEPFAAPLMDALERLIDAIRSRHPVPAERVVGHECVAPGRKIDPGPKFDWRRLALGGRAVWFEPPPRPDGGKRVPAAAFAAAAGRFGYPTPEPGAARWGSPEMEALWHAVAARFLPHWPGDAVPDAAALEHLEALAARWPVASG